MPQPVRKIIKETHSDLIAEEPIYTLLVDGNSLLFACFADDKKNLDGKHYGAIWQFLLQLKIQLNKKDYDYVYVFFDDEYSGWLRWNLYPYYKANRDKHYQDYGISEYMKQYNANLKAMQHYLYNKKRKKPIVEVVPKQESEWDKFIDENFNRERDILCSIFNELYIRWYIDEIVEGDDLISFYCQNKKKNEKIVIVSGDEDITQLISDDICVYNLRHKKYISPANFNTYFGYCYENVMVKKVFCGDVSDNIGNIKRMSESAFYEMMPEVKTKKITIEDVKNRAEELIKEREDSKKKPLQLHENILKGISNKDYNGDFYEINKTIIDLKNPMLSDEAKETLDSMMYAPQDPEGRSIKNVYEIILSEGIDELKGDTTFGSFFRTFNKLAEKEIKRYNESIKK